MALQSLLLSFSYDVTTPESAEEGDVAECGSYTPGGWKYPLPHYPGGVELDGHPKPEQVGAHEALRTIRDTISGGIDHIEVQGGHMSVYPSDASQDFRTGADTRIMAHVRGDRRLIAALARELRRR